MGSGKTTLGKFLAEKKKYSFLDSDEWIEKNEHLSVSQIFELKGEDKFRTLEKDFIEFSKTLNNVVIAAGGGLPCYNKLMNEILKIGTVIYLKATPKVLFDRLKIDDHRPLLRKLNKDEKLKFITNMLSEREQYYHQADFTIDASKSIDEQINEIQCRLI